MNGTSAFAGAGLIAVWPVPAGDIDRDALIAAALPDLQAIAADAGCYLYGPSTWRVIHDVDQLDGWDGYTGDLLVATTVPRKHRR